jgi:excisionase family DNA binding protein
VPNKLLLSVPEACEMLGLSRSSIYALMRMGSLESISIGRRRLIPVAAVDALIAAVSER